MRTKRSPRNVRRRRGRRGRRSCLKILAVVRLCTAFPGEIHNRNSGTNCRRRAANLTTITMESVACMDLLRSRMLEELSDNSAGFPPSCVRNRDSAPGRSLSVHLCFYPCSRARQLEKRSLPPARNAAGMSRSVSANFRSSRLSSSARYAERSADICPRRYSSDGSISW